MTEEKKKNFINNFMIAILTFRDQYKEILNEDKLKSLIDSGKEILIKKFGDNCTEKDKRDINEVIEKTS
jgi:predicted transcriptional regulator